MHIGVCAQSVFRAANNSPWLTLSHPRVSVPLAGSCCRSCCCADRPCPHPTPCHMPALWELSFNNTLMEKFMKNQIIAAGRELKPFFIPCIPGPRLRAPPWEHCTSHPSLWPASRAQITAAILC